MSKDGDGRQYGKCTMQSKTVTLQTSERHKTCLIHIIINTAAIDVLQFTKRNALAWL